MGRRSFFHGESLAQYRCFRVRLDSGGYDDGGAYWGIGMPLYCIENEEDEHGVGNRMFHRAMNRDDAKQAGRDNFGKDIVYYR